MNYITSGFQKGLVYSFLFLLTINFLVLGYGGKLMAQTSTPHLKTAYFAGGCFWCMEEVFESVEGVVDAISGYTGGDFPNPTYEDVSYKNTGHYEAVRVIYDPRKVDYRRLLDYFWVNIDPTQEDGQFCDQGRQYLSAIFYTDPAEKKLAEETLEEYRSRINTSAVKGDVRFVTAIEPLKKFYDAEDYHQSYYSKNSIRYKTYKYLCGRSQRLEQLWR